MSWENTLSKSQGDFPSKKEALSAIKNYIKTEKERKKATEDLLHKLSTYLESMEHD